jgi:transcriptional regulator with XRE-family HTH domain
MPTIGDYIRQQREQAKISLRQLADQAGVSNPYLSQIERGLRKPSADILQQLARALHVSAETLYVQAGILDPRDGPEPDLEHEIQRDSSLTESQKQALIEVYRSFQREGRDRPEPGTT